MEFKKYNKIQNATKQKEINRALNELPDSEWLVSEKVHGANLHFVTDGVDVKVGSRNQYVEKTFYNAGNVFGRYKPLVLALFKELKLKEGKDVLRLYGELYGGNIQKEIKYKKKDFIAFDMMINDEYVTNFLEAATVLTLLGIPVVPTKRFKTLEEALSYPNDTPSKLSPTGDIIEGTIIRPLEEYTFRNGKRCIFKNKNEKFSEKKNRKVKLPEILTEKEKELLQEIIPYINENRVANVISKIGTITQKDFGNIMKMTTQDIQEDFTEDNGYDFLEKDEWDNIKKSFNRELSQVVRNQFLKYLE